MPITTILVPLYDGALDTVVVDAAAKLAGKFNAHIETLLMKVPLDITGGLISNMLDTKQYKQLIDDLARQTQSEENAAQDCGHSKCSQHSLQRESHGKPPCE